MRLTIDDVLSAASDRAGSDNPFSSIALATAGGTVAGTIGALGIVPAYLVGRQQREVKAEAT